VAPQGAEHAGADSLAIVNLPYSAADPHTHSAAASAFAASNMPHQRLPETVWVQVDVLVTDIKSVIIQRCVSVGCIRCKSALCGSKWVL
jgi:hypothetical protein